MYINEIDRVKTLKIINCHVESVFLVKFSIILYEMCCTSLKVWVMFVILGSSKIIVNRNKRLTFFL